MTKVSEELSNREIGEVMATIQNAADQVKEIVADMEKAVEDIEGDMPEVSVSYDQIVALNFIMWDLSYVLYGDGN